MVRGGLWLVSEVGEGNVFTKQQLREAFPGESQIDRRVRELRAYGWEILSSTEDVRLHREEQRFVAMGVPVWDRQARRKAAATSATAVDRSAVLQRDNFMCTVCGITGGEAYLDAPSMTAVLSVVRRNTLMPDGDEGVLLVTECKRCHTGTRNRAVTTAAAVEALRDLDDAERRHLKRWVARGRRGSTALDRAWANYWNLPQEAKQDFESALGE